MNQHLNQSAALVSDRHRRFEAEARSYRNRPNRGRGTDHSSESNDRSRGRGIRLRSVTPDASLQQVEPRQAPIAAAVRSWLVGVAATSS